MRNRLAITALLTCSPLFAQSRFDGTWEMKMDTLQFSGPPEEYLIDKGMYHCVSCVPQVDVRTDGTDQKTAGHEAFYDTISVKIIDARTIKFAFKKDGKPAAISIETVSPDGKTMLEKFSNSIQADKVAGKAEFTRISPGPPGSHALSGKWRMKIVRNNTSAGTLTTFESIPGGLKISMAAKPVSPSSTAMTIR
jgi:hypothetical protein